MNKQLGKNGWEEVSHLTVNISINLPPNSNNIDVIKSFNLSPTIYKCLNCNQNYFDDYLAKTCCEVD